MNEDNNLKSIIIEPKIAATKSIIWLHGLGADGNDFVPIIPELKLPPTLGIRFIFPNAPIMPITINSGYEMPGWFDIYDLSIAAKIDEAGIARSTQQIEHLIENEIARGIASENIILAGFSQGAVIALNTGIRYPKRLAGIIALSGYLPLADQVIQHASPSNRNIPIFMAHGTEDPIVPYALGKSTYTMLEQAGLPISWHSYPMPHSVCAEEVIDIGRWVEKRF